MTQYIVAAVLVTLNIMCLVIICRDIRYITKNIRLCNRQ